jgi:D-sedoheptulose 7-phosphate isomerase
MCGRAAGLTTVLVATGKGRDTLADVRSGRVPPPDHVTPDLGAAVDWIIARARRNGRLTAAFGAAIAASEMKESPMTEMKGSPMTDRIAGAFRASAELFEKLVASAGEVARAAELLVVSFRSGNKLLVLGNGGSAADAQHLAAELVGRFYVDRPPLPAIALTTNTSNLTAIANDYGYDLVFARQVEAFARPGDAVMGISTSGNSESVVLALEAARRIGAKTIALTGARPCRLDSCADIVLKVPSTDTPRIQEGHIAIGHMLCQLVEEAALAERWEPAGRDPAPR